MFTWTIYNPGVSSVYLDHILSQAIHCFLYSSQFHRYLRFPRYILIINVCKKFQDNLQLEEP